MTDSRPSTMISDLKVVPLRSQLLSSLPGIIHGLTHRVEGMGKADGNVGYSGERDREDAWEMRQQWCVAIGVEPARMVLVGQVHGNDVLEAKPEHTGAGAAPGSQQVGYADALMTDHADLVLATLHADCLPILIVDPRRPAIAAVHAGWRGTVLDVAGATVKAMQERYGSEPADLLVYLGPAIGGCCNEVGPEVTGAWREQAADLGPLKELAVTKPGPKEHFDVPRANMLLLHRAGVQPENMEVSATCTKCSTDEWFSHRGHGPTAGRQAAMIMLSSAGDAE